MDAYWAEQSDAVLTALGSSPDGLASSVVSARLAEHAGERLRASTHVSGARLFVRQFTSPILVILMAGAVIAAFVGDAVDSIIIMIIVTASGMLGFVQEHSASRAVEALLATIRVSARVIRDGKAQDVPVGEVVPGDVVELVPGDVVPADVRILEASALFVDQATLTGESFPVEKTAATVAKDAPLARRESAAFLGTHVVSGRARAIAVHVGSKTELGAVSGRLHAPPPVTDFERGVRRLGAVLLEVTLLLVIAIVVCNVYLGRPVIDSLLFAVALAVGLTPQLLPAIISVNLARGSRRMADERVIVKRLESIENFGSMSVLCTDKTGTLTEGVVRIGSALAFDGAPSDEPLRLARLNAAHAAHSPNPIDDTIRASGAADAAEWKKVGELPYDFARKRVSVMLSKGGVRLLIVKGAVDPLIACCTRARRPDGTSVPIDDARATIGVLLARLTNEGHRILGVAERTMDTDAMRRDDEHDLTLVGFLTLSDTPKAHIVETVARLRSVGVRICMLTGDSAGVAAYVARNMGTASPRVITGATLDHTSDAALIHLVRTTDVFAELAPHDKERIVRAQRSAGEVVGFLGDGINDASAIHAADVGISVDTGADVAKDAAAIVLLDKDLAVLLRGIEEGRRTFANTLKYVFMATSANFGNMFSMAGASLMLPFLPLLPKQVLLTNLLTDLSEMTIADDRVDDEWIARPRRWDVRLVTRFMIVFGLVSSLFDYLTFGVLMWGMHASEVEFRTGWFVESVVSATTIVLVVRTQHPAWRSRPSKALARAAVGVIGATILLPFTPLAAPLGFAPLPLRFYAVLAVIVLSYAAAVEVAKHFFFRREASQTARDDAASARRDA